MGVMLAATPSREISEWQAYERVCGPLGPQRTDHMLAMVAAVVANTARDPKRRSQPFEAADFLPWSDVDRPEQTPEEQMAIFEQLAAMSQAVEQR